MSTVMLQPPAGWPWLLLALPLAWLSRWWSQRAAARSRAVLGSREYELIGAPAYRTTRATLAGAAVLLVVVALLRPVTPGREAQFAPDVVLCVDVSRSMQARDLQPSRFAVLREVVHRWLDEAVGARVALLAFAGDVVPIAPLTADRDAVRWLLDELVPGAHARGGTDLSAAIDAAVATLARVGTAGEIVLLTDGEDFAQAGARRAAASAAAGHRVHALGFGSAAGSKIVIEQAGEQAFLKDRAGRDVVTRLDVDGLKAIAAAGGGRFAQVRGDDLDELVALWREDLLPQAARRRIAAGADDVVLLAHWPLLAGLILWIVRMCLSERRR